MRVKGFRIACTLFMNSELSSASPPPVVLDRKLKFRLISCLSKFVEHLGGLQYSPSSLLTLNQSDRQEVSSEVGNTKMLDAWKWHEIRYVSMNGKNQIQELKDNLWTILDD